MTTIVAMIGPIEWWWNTENDPHRFESDEAKAFRAYRTYAKNYLGNMGFLVYAPWDAFYGPWDERAQAHNDFIVGIADIVVNIRPVGIPGKGTDHEIELAQKLNKPIYFAPPGTDLDFLAFVLDGVDSPSKTC